MKKTLMLVATMVLSIASFANFTVPPVPTWDLPLVVEQKIVDAESYEKPCVSLDPTEYYWFEFSTGDYLYRQSTIADEMWFTDFNESTYNPKTTREYGYAPSSVWVDGSGYPTPVTGPDKILYSHP